MIYVNDNILRKCISDNVKKVNHDQKNESSLSNDISKDFCPCPIEKESF